MDGSTRDLGVWVFADGDVYCALWRDYIRACVCNNPARGVFSLGILGFFMAGR